MKFISINASIKLLLVPPVNRITVRAMSFARCVNRYFFIRFFGKINDCSASLENFIKCVCGCVLVHFTVSVTNVRRTNRAFACIFCGKVLAHIISYRHRDKHGTDGETASHTRSHGIQHQCEYAIRTRDFTV